MTSTNGRWMTAVAVVVAAAALSLTGCRNRGQAGGGGASASTSPGAGLKIPDNARKVAESHNGQRIIHRLLRQGTVFVQEAETGRVAYSGQVRASSNVTVDPKANAIAVNDVQVRGDPKLDVTKGYRLYFVGR
jgi:hypothetical protein